MCDNVIFYNNSLWGDSLFAFQGALMQLGVYKNGTQLGACIQKMQAILSVVEWYRVSD